MQLTSKSFFLLKKSTTFLNYFSEKIISIDKIPAILQAFKVVIFCPTAEHSGIWVGLLVTWSKEKAQNTEEVLEWVLSAVKYHPWGICASYFIKNGQDFYTKELYHLAIQFGV